jgi:hypothetical protein
LINVAGEGSSFDRYTLEFVGDLPGWLLWVGQASYVVGVVYSFGLLIGVGVFARGRLGLLRDMLLAAVFAGGLALCVPASVGSISLGEAIFINVVVSATLIFRLLSFYLPPIWGYVALKWLKQRDYL